DDELMGYAFNFYLGGLDTVTAHTANFVRHLATHPDQQRYLRENPAQIRTAVEEFMRAFAAVTTYRTCSKETRIRGVTIKPGDRVAMITTLAGRDGQVYDDPHSVRLDRNPRHVSFAVGPHHCLGVHLARRELRIALEETFKAIPEFRLDPDVPIESQAGVIIQPRNLPLVWGGGRSARLALDQRQRQAHQPGLQAVGAAGEEDRRPGPQHDAGATGATQVAQLRGQHVAGLHVRHQQDVGLASHRGVDVLEDGGV